MLSSGVGIGVAEKYFENEAVEKELKTRSFADGKSIHGDIDAPFEGAKMVSVEALTVSCRAKPAKPPITAVTIAAYMLFFEVGTQLFRTLTQHSIFQSTLETVDGRLEVRSGCILSLAAWTSAFVVSVLSAAQLTTT